MNTTNITSLLVLFFIILISSCQNENVDEIVPQNPNYQIDTVSVNPLVQRLQSSSSDGLELACIKILYPFELLQESGNTLTITSESDFNAAIELTGPESIKDFVFPLSAEDKDGNIISFGSNAELGNGFISCIPTTGWTNAVENETIIPAHLPLCYDLVYPVNLQDEEGNTYVAMNEVELINLVASHDLLFYALPFSVQDQGGNEISVESVSIFFELMHECADIHPPVTGDGLIIQGFGCLELIYPVNVTLADGSALTVNSVDEYANLTLNGEQMELQYPFTLKNNNGELLEIENLEHLIAALTSCGVVITDPNACEFTDAHVLLFFNALNILTFNNYPYDISYPVTLNVAGNEVVVNNGDEYLPAIGGSPFNFPNVEIIYPVTITQFGQQIVLNNDDDVCEFYQTLSEPCENKPAHIQFFFNEGGGVPANCAYSINYPVNIVLGGVTIEIQTREDYLEELNNSPNAYNAIQLVYPLSITRFIDGQEFTFSSEDDICEYLNNCQ